MSFIKQQIRHYQKTGFNNKILFYDIDEIKQLSHDAYIILRKALRKNLIISNDYYNVILEIAIEGVPQPFSNVIQDDVKRKINQIATSYGNGLALKN